MKTLDTNKKKCFTYFLHKLITVSLYGISFLVSYFILSIPEIEGSTSIITVLSAGALLATFGSALSSLGGIYEKDLVERLLCNVDILFIDILKIKKWRRWNFLPRTSKRKQLDGNHLYQTLENPILPLDVGSHILKIEIPTTLEDFFDLKMLKNVTSLVRFKKASSTTLFNKDKEVCPKTKMRPDDEFFAYECLHDIWISIFKFRCFRYITHFGCGLTIFGFILTAIITWKKFL